MTRHPAYDPFTGQWYVHNPRYPTDLSEGYDCLADAEAACEEREDDGE